MMNARRVALLGIPLLLILVGVSFWIVTAWSTRSTDYGQCRHLASQITAGLDRAEVVQRFQRQQITTVQGALVAVCCPAARRTIPLPSYPVKAVRIEVRFDANDRVSGVDVDDVVWWRKNA